MAVKINQLEIENTKRIRAVKLEVADAGLTVIGGKNGQGKTSVLDAIAWVLGGDRFRPSQPMREGSAIPPALHIKLSNGLVVERKGKNSDLKVIDPEGRKGGQQLLNEFVEQMALDLPRFMQSSSKEKANTLLQIIGVGDRLFVLEKEEAELYNRRHAIGQVADQKEKFAREMPTFANVPDELVSASALIRQQQNILATNGENQRKRQRLGTLISQAEEVQRQLDALLEKQRQIHADLDIAQKDAIELHDESTAELEANISAVDEINRKVRANLDRSKAEDDAKDYRRQYDELTARINATRQAKMDLLSGAELPLAGLSVEDGELTYNGYKWDNMAASEQLRVATAIVRRLNPNCGFVLLDKLEQMDIDTLREFGAWLESEGLQAIATRVSTGGECSVIISDGYVEEPQTQQQQKAWKEGVF